METLRNIIKMVNSAYAMYRFKDEPKLRGSWTGVLGRMTSEENGLMNVIIDAEQICKMDNEQRGYCTFFIGPEPCVYVSDIDMVYEIFAFCDTKISRKKPLDIFARIGGHDNVFMIDSGPEHLEKRRCLKAYVYDPASLRKYVPQIREIAREYIGRVSGEISQQIDFTAFFSQFTMNVVGDLVLGLKNLDDPLLAAKVSGVITEVLGAAQDPRYLFGDSEKIAELKDKLRSMYKDLLIGPNRDAITGSKCLLGDLAAKSGGLETELMLSDGFASLLAGHETTAMTLVFATLLLAENPVKVQKLRAALEVLPDDYLLANLEAIPYLEAVVLETLRLYPPVSVIPRGVVEDFVIKRPGPHIRTHREYELIEDSEFFKFRENDLIFVSPAILHHSERYFEDADSFIPERFLDRQGQVLNARNPIYRAFIPFGLGTRNCIGQKFAKIEAKIMIAELFRKDVSVSLDAEVPVSYVGTTRPGVPVCGYIS